MSFGEILAEFQNHCHFISSINLKAVKRKPVYLIIGTIKTVNYGKLILIYLLTHDLTLTLILTRKINH